MAADMEYAGFLASILLAGVMGFAIQRGATCTVAAVAEVVEKGRCKRLLAMLEASVWVAGGLLIAQSLHALGGMPGGYPAATRTVIGGVLLGLGAYINGACVFGAIARLGSGQWAYAVTPVGFYAGCVTVDYVFGPAVYQRLPYGSLVLRAPEGLALAFVAFVLWRAGRPAVGAWRQAGQAAGEESVIRRLHQMLAARVWSPHAATIVIGVAFFFMMILAGPWAYTEVLSELARRMTAASLLTRGVLFAALLAGAIFGGWTAGLLRRTRASASKLLACFSGGMMMGWGSLLIPGGNDGLILVGMPLLWPYAWIAFASMCVTIGAAMLVRRSLAQRLAGAAHMSAAARRVSEDA